MTLKMKKPFAFVLSFAMFMSVAFGLPSGIFSAEKSVARAAAAGAFEVTGGTEGIDYTYEDGLLTINSATPLTIANADPSAATTDSILVADGVCADITLAGVNIDVHSADKAALKIADNSEGNVTITLADGTLNTLDSGYDHAGLHKNGVYISQTQGSLTIQGGELGTGTLIATGGDYGAGIGSGYAATGANITISGGTVVATGGMMAAGIGGGCDGEGTYITISGGTVLATGGGSSAGIGGGARAAGSNITISGGEVTAMGGNNGAGIGGGSGSAGSYISISGGTVLATGGECGAGIGGSDNGKGSYITISGGEVVATGGMMAAGIGGGYGNSGSYITISGGTVLATGGSSSAGIGGGGAGIGGGKSGAGSFIVIENSSVKAVAGENANAIGGGYGVAICIPTLSDGSTSVYEAVVEVDGTSDVTVDGVLFPSKHADESSVYLYLTGMDHIIVNGDKKYYAEFDSDASAFNVTQMVAPSASQFVFTAPESLIFDGAPKTVTVQPDSDITGIGDVTVIITDENGNEFESAVNAGTYYVSIDVSEGTRYLAASGITDDSWKFTILPMDKTVETPPAVSAVNGQVLHQIELPDHWEWVAPFTNIDITSTSAQAYFINIDPDFTYKNDEGYDAQTGRVIRDIPLIVSKADSYIVMDVYNSYPVENQSIDVSVCLYSAFNNGMADGTVLTSYKIGGGEKISFTDCFYIPDGLPIGSVITIYAEFEGNEGYNASTKTATITVQACSHPDIEQVDYSSDDTAHWKICGICREFLGYSEHTGGEADCMKAAQCEVCNTLYGDRDDDNHIAVDKSEYVYNESEHWYACACGGKADVQSHSAVTAPEFEKMGICKCTRECTTYLGDVNTSYDYADLRDVVLLYQYHNNWDVEINHEVADVNGDDDISIRDVVMLYQYCCGWDV